MTRGLRIAWGGVLLVAPRALLTLCGGDRSPAVVLGARILGARHVVEGVVMASEHDPRPPTWMVAVDASHAGSMLALAAVSPRLRRDALASAAAATTLVALSMKERGRAGRAGPA